MRKRVRGFYEAGVFEKGLGVKDSEYRGLGFRVDGLEA